MPVGEIIFFFPKLEYDYFLIFEMSGLGNHDYSIFKN